MLGLEMLPGLKQGESPPTLWEAWCRAAALFLLGLGNYGVANLGPPAAGTLWGEPEESEVANLEIAQGWGRGDAN